MEDATAVQSVAFIIFFLSLLKEEYTLQSVLFCRGTVMVVGV